MTTSFNFSTNPSLRKFPSPVQRLPEKLSRALAMLAEAADYAERTGASRWDFAVEIGQIRSLGMSDNDLRYLATLQYIEHAAEITVADDRVRRFAPESDLIFTHKSCLILAQSKRLKVFRTNGVRNHKPVTATVSRRRIRSQHSRQVPVWNAAQRILVFNNQVIKQFKRQAINQEIILAAFQEEGWPARIDDPLAPQATIDGKRRLNDAIKSLNRRRLANLMHFRGDGSGQAVIWGT